MTTAHSFVFKRPHLASALCDSLEGRGIANSRSGLFLAGPRRVGKTTFLKSELAPVSTERGWETVYVDLWADRSADPAAKIAEAIKSSMANYEGVITKLAKAARLDKVNVMGAFALDFSKSGLPDNMTLADALRLLHAMSGKPVLLIIDEAQHALTTEAGLNAMFALKSARDQLNSPDKPPVLMLAFTGSNRDKLAQLVLKKDQPFFGSDITPFPLLGREYSDAFTGWVNASLAGNNQFSRDSMWTAFQLVGHRPEILADMAGRVAISGDAANLSERLQENALVWHGRIWDEFESDYNTLTPLQKAILTTLIEKGRNWSPFGEASVRRYEALTGEAGIATSTIQTAITALRDRGLIWNSGRGGYALEDESFGTWFLHHQANEAKS